MEKTGDTAIIAAPATGPAAPGVAAVGEVLSTVGTVGNITMDVVEGDLESAAKRVAVEVITGGLSSIAKNAPGVDENASQLIDSHIGTYENVIIPAVQKKIEEE